MRSFALEAPASAVLYQFWRVDFTDLIYPTQFLLLAYTADIATASHAWNSVHFRYQKDQRREP